MRTSSKLARQILAGSIFGLVLASLPAAAANVTWDTLPGTIGTGDGAITGGAGVWNDSTAATPNGNWTTDGGATNVAWVNANNDVAIFGVTGGAATLGSAITANGLTFNVGGYTLSGAGLTLAGATPTLSVTNAGDSATLSVALAGTAGLNTSGAGTLILSGANTYTGGTAIAAGILQANAVAALQGATTVAAGGQLKLSVPGGTWSNAITGTGRVVIQTGGATAINTSVNGLSGFAGTIEIATATTTGDKWSSSGGAANATLVIDNNTQYFLSSGSATFSAIQASGTGNTENRGAMRLIGALTATNGVTLLGNTTIGTENGSLTGAITGTATTGNTQTLTLGTVNSTGTGAFTGIIANGTGGGALAVNVAAGTSTLNSANTYTGGTTITAGRLNAGNAAAFGTGAVTIGNGATLGVTTTANPDTIANAITLAGAAATIDTSAAGTTAVVTLSGAITGTSGLTLAANGNTSDSGGSVGGSLLLSNTGNSFAGNITITSGVVDLTSKLGAATNAVVLNGGGLVDKNNNVAFSRAIQVGSAGGYLRAYGSATTAYSGPISNVDGVGFTTIRLIDSGTRNLSGDGSGFIGAITGATGNFQVTGAGANWRRTDFVVSAGTMTVSGGGTTAIKSLTKTANNDVIVNNGTLLDIASGNVAWTPVSGSWIKTTAGTAGTLTSSSGVLTIANGGFTGAITIGDQQEQLVLMDFNASTPLTFSKGNQNTLVLTAANTYTGGTVINGGALLATQALPATGTVLINRNGAFGSATAAATLLGSGSLATASTGTLLISQNVAGALDLTAYPGLNLSAAPTAAGFAVGGTTLSGAITAGANGYQFGTPGLSTTLTTVGALSGTGVALTKRGSDALIIAGTNSYTGATTINGGTVTLDFSNAASPASNILNAASALTLGGGTLQVTGLASTVNSQALAGTTLAPGTASAVAATAGASGSASLGLGTLARNAGATVNFTLPATGTIGLTGGAAALLTDGTTGGAFATLGAAGTDWAALDASSHLVAATYTDATGTLALAGNANLTGAVTLSANSAPASVRTVTAGTNIALGGFALATAGILSNQTITISGTGSLTPATAGGELVFDQTAGTATVSAIIANNGTASSLTKIGAGTLALTGANTLSGSIYVTQGTLNTGNAAALGNANVIIGPGATLRENNATSLGGTGTITLMDGAMLRQEAANAVGTLSRNIVLSSPLVPAMIGGFLFGNGSITTSTISGTGDVMLGNWDTSNGGIFRNGWTTNSYAGQTYVTGRGANTIQLDFGGTAPANNAVVTPFGANTNPSAILYNALVAFSNLPSTANNYYVDNALTLDASGNYATGNVALTFSDGVAHLKQGLTVKQAGANTATLTVAYSNKPVQIDGALAGYGTLKLTSSSQAGATIDLNAAGTFNGVISLEGSATLAPYLQLNADGAAPRATIALGSAVSRLVIGTANATVAGLTGVAGSDVSATGGSRTLTVNNTDNFNYLGTIGVNGVTLALVKSGPGTFTLTGANVYTGGTTVNGGTLLANNISGSASGTLQVAVGSGGTFGGTGAVAGAVSVSGTLSPGVGIESLKTGALALNGGSTFKFDLANTSGTGADLLAANGSLTFAGTATLSLTDTGTWALGDKVTLISYTGAALAGIDGTTMGFAGLADDSTFALGANSWQINYDDSTGGANFAADSFAGSKFVTLTVVPEPASAATLLCGLGLLAGLRRRRRP